MPPFFAAPAALLVDETAILDLNKRCIAAVALRAILRLSLDLSPQQFSQCNERGLAETMQSTGLPAFPSRQPQLRRGLKVDTDVADHFLHAKYLTAAMMRPHRKMQSSTATSG